MKINRVWMLALTVAVIVALFGVGYVLTRPAAPQPTVFGADYPGHEGQGVFFADGDTLVVADGGTLEMQSGSTVTGADATFTGGVTATGGFVGDLTGNVTGDITGNTGTFTQTLVLVQNDEALEIADGGVITPTTTYCKITSTDVVTACTMGKAAVDGTLVILRNTGLNVITITDGSTAVLAGDMGMGEDDTLTMIYRSQFEYWVEIARSNN